jgi:hypothetical protein
VVGAIVVAVGCVGAGVVGCGGLVVVGLGLVVVGLGDVVLGVVVWEPPVVWPPLLPPLLLPPLLLPLPPPLPPEVVEAPAGTEDDEAVGVTSPASSPSSVGTTVDADTTGELVVTEALSAVVAGRLIGLVMPFAMAYAGPASRTSTTAPPTTGRRSRRGRGPRCLPT